MIAKARKTSRSTSRVASRNRRACTASNAFGLDRSFLGAKVQPLPKPLERIRCHKPVLHGLRQDRRESQKQILDRSSGEPPSACLRLSLPLVAGGPVVQFADEEVLEHWPRHVAHLQPSKPRDQVQP